MLYLNEKQFLMLVFNKFVFNNPLTSKILNHNEFSLNEDYERALPGNPEFIDNGWWKIMLLRYAIAMFFSQDKITLDTCSGLGWGAYMLSGVSKKVFCIEIDKPSINFSKKNWENDNIVYINCSVIEMPFKDGMFNVVTAMESIEHFNLYDIKLYLKEIYRVLKNNGYIIGSSTFPDTREQAQIICSKNKYHLHICTKEEIKILLKDIGFKEIYIFKNNLFFIAKK